MSMSEEQLEKTGILRIMLDKADRVEESTLLERIELFEDKIEYLNIEEEKKNKLIELVEKIKLESDEKVQEFLFKELIRIIEDI